jgi:hypothetical protein
MLHVVLSRQIASEAHDWHAKHAESAFSMSRACEEAALESDLCIILTANICSSCNAAAWELLAAIF